MADYGTCYTNIDGRMSWFANQDLEVFSCK
jgi:hypothetical protein